MRKSTKKYTKPVGKTRRKSRKKLQASQNQYALPTSYQVTSTQQTISGDPEKAEQLLEAQNMTRRQRLRAQREAEKERIQAAKDARERELAEVAGQGLEYAGEVAKKKAKEEAAEETIKKAAESAVAVTPSVVAPTTAAVAPGVSATSAQTLATQGSGMSQAYGNQLLNQQLLADPALATGAKSAAVTQGTSTAGSATGQAAASAGRAGIMGTQSAAVTPIALGANLAGTAIKHFGADEDDTTYNAAEISGGLLQKAGEFGGYGAMLGTIVPGLGNVAGGIIGGVAGLAVGGAQMINRKKKAQEAEAERTAKENEQKLREGLAEKELFAQAFGTQGRDLGYNIGQGVGNSYLGGYQMAKAGGKKVPGGEVLPLPGGAVEFRGNKHGESGKGSSSGIVLQESTKAQAGVEVEDKETMDKIKFADGNTDDYIFSSYLKLGGKSFAQRHKDILRKGGSQKQIQELAKLQEEKAKAVKKTPVGPTDQYGPRGKEYIARYGGVKPRIKAQSSKLPDMNIPMPDVTQQPDALGGPGFTESEVINQLKPVAPTLPSSMQRQLDPVLEQQAQEAMDDYEQAMKIYDRVSGETPANISPFIQEVQQDASTTEDPAQSTGTAAGASSAAGASASKTQPAPTQTPTTPGVEYKDALVTQDGVQFSTEDFKRKGRGSSIDYSGDINASSWEDVLNTNWAENIIGDREVSSKEELKKIYDEEYVPQVESFFENNPEQAYDAIVNFALSGNPNAANLKKKIFKNGKLVSEEEVLRIGLENATDGKVGTFHSLFTGQGEDRTDMDPMESLPPQEIPTEINKELAVEQPEEVKDANMRLKPPKVRDIPPLAYLGAAAQALGPAFALATKYDQPERVSPGVQGRERLARVNYNAERASNLNATTSANRYIQNVASGPAAVALTMASNNNARNQALQIANAEARANTQIKNAETAMNARIAQANLANDLQAKGLNAQAQNVRDQLEYEKKVNAMSALGNIGGQFASDALEYKAVNRQARANQIAGEFTRQEYTEALQKRPKYRKMLKEAGIDPNDTRALRRISAAMWDPNVSMEDQDQKLLDFIAANPNIVQQKSGGRSYVKKSGKVKRKTRK